MSRAKLPSAISRVRNSLRPFYNMRQEQTFRSRTTPTFWKQIQAVRQEAGKNDYSAILSIVEDNRAYPFPGLGNTFPTEESKTPNPQFGHLRPLKLANELGLQVARLNHHASRVKPALESLAAINDHLIAGRLMEVEAALAAHKKSHGLSLIVLKKDLLAALERSGLPGLSRRYKVLTAHAQSTAWALLAHYVYDLIDPTYNPTRAVQRWLRLAERRVAEHPWFARILQDEVLTRIEGAPAMSCSLLRYSATSLLDLAILVWRKRNIHSREQAVQDAYSNLASPLKSILEDRFTAQPIQVSRMYSRKARLPDVEIYRTSFFFDDIASVVQWRSEFHGLIFAERYEGVPVNIDSNGRRLSDAADQIAADPTRMNRIIEGLADWENGFLGDNPDVERRSFLLAVVVAESVRRLSRNPQGDPSEIAELLADTDDIQFFTSSGTLKQLRDSDLACNSLLLTFVLWELIYRRDRTQDNELDRRLAFMRLFAGNSPLVEVLGQIAVANPSAATLLAKTCSRTFLERLFMMMSSVKDVLEARLSICRWLIDRKDPSSDNLQEESEALVRELANLEARSDLDSTRVHVDEESIREWFETLHATSVTRYKQTALAEGPVTSFGSLLTFFSTVEKAVDDFTAETQIGSEFLLVAIVDATLKAFVSDRTFGLDAYLSRRIRHGTLNGHVMTPITRVLGQLTDHVKLHGRAHDSSDHSGALVFAQEFREFLSSELDHARKDVIQIRSPEHPQGLIQAQWRTAGNIQHLDAMIARVRGRVIETGGSYDIFPDIYSFCWDCLESDLAQLRLYMLREFAPAATRKLSELYEHLSSADRALVFPYLHECRDTLEARVQEVCGWFIRPVFRRDRYNLKMLISTTLSIVRELDYEYAFTEDVVVSDDISLNRGSFDVFGDALFVLLGNAARHGKRDGNIHVDAQILPGKKNVVKLDITSEVDSRERYLDARARIDTALTNDYQAIAQAAVQEGFSGLMKLAGVMRRVRSPDVQLQVTGDEESLKINFSLILPSEITVTRMRG
ncbi:hypothetical protein [Bradyrhizobium sp. CCBAU 53351]|uniref:hypothetical protein n=1 Tax=Bradyrhizobium sp. CCBAU 53351 TaxID=1325114 RepID=UPI001887F91D|nr:hypothetical protein [Bradyrhizobium sp. CCBAU 53351]